LLYNGHGSVRQLSNSSGGIVTDQVYSYDAYGVSLGYTGTKNTNLQYAGEQFDNDLDQYYLRARYYSPKTGTFNRVDPFSGNLQDPQSLHKYLYCHANPVNGIDPNGERFNLVRVLTTITIGFILCSLTVITYIAFKDPAHTFGGIIKDLEAALAGGYLINIKIDGKHKWRRPRTILKTYKSNIKTAARLQNIPPDLLAGVLYTEMKHYALFSDFGADYVGYGSLGPAQLQVENVKKWVPELRSKSDSEIADMLLDPATAIDILSKSVDDFNRMAKDDIIGEFRSTQEIDKRSVWSGKMSSAKDNWGLYSNNWYMNTLGPEMYKSALDILWKGSLPAE